jgi:hypothetical protein
MQGRALVLVALAVSCTTEAEVPELPDRFEQVWTETIRPGDLIVAVPGTGGYDTLGLAIEQAIDPEQPEAVPVLDGRTVIAGADTFEGAIAAATRAGLTGPELEAGAVTFGVWGAGITKTTKVHYQSLGGLRVTFEVIGGASVCAFGGVAQNLLKYNRDNAEIDARDLYRRVQTWLEAEPSPDRNVIVVAHSWGGVVAEFLAQHLAMFEAQHDPLPEASVAFVIAAGVPALVPDFAPLGPNFRTVDSVEGEVTASARTYEIDRPDDPAHTFDPQGNPGGHHYIIMFGDSYEGFYGITTDELSCAGTPGACPPRE